MPFYRAFHLNKLPVRKTKAFLGAKSMCLVFGNIFPLFMDYPDWKGVKEQVGCVQIRELGSWNHTPPLIK